MEQKMAQLCAELPDEAIPFFVVFSRFEYALKRSPDYLKGDASAKWMKFAKTLGKAFFDEVRKAKIAKTLLSAPPWKQVVDRGQLDWKKNVPVVDRVSELILAICRVRNNLVHGGKFPSPTGPVSTNSQRDRTLLDEARKVLEKALEHAHCPRDVKDAFWDLPENGLSSK